MRNYCYYATVACAYFGFPLTSNAATYYSCHSAVHGFVSVAKSADGGDLTKLLKERVVLAKEIHDLTVREFKLGAQVKIDEVHRTKVTLLSAQLDLAQTKENKIKILRDTVREAEEWVQTVDKLVQAGQANRIAGLAARFYLLDCRITLEKTSGSR